MRRQGRHSPAVQMVATASTHGQRSVPMCGRRHVQTPKRDVFDKRAGRTVAVLMTPRIPYLGGVHFLGFLGPTPQTPSTGARMKRLHVLLARPIVRIVSLSLLFAVAVALIIMGNMSRWTAHSGAQSIAASEAAAIVKNGQARSILVQFDHAYLKTNDTEYVFIKDREASVPQMLATLGVSSAEMASVVYTVDES